MSCLVIFDCDGVLVDSEIISCRILTERLNALGMPFTLADVIRRFCGKSRKTMLAEVEREYGRPLSEDFKTGYHQATLKALSEQVQPIAGIQAVLAAVKLKCVASGGPHDKIANSLRATGLADYFSPAALFSADEVEHGKPAPDLFLLAAARMGFAPKDCIVVEDSVFGVMAAKAAGMRSIGFTGAAHFADDPARQAALLRQAGATHVVGAMVDLPAQIGL